jgi:hypothetical protein
VNFLESITSESNGKGSALRIALLIWTIIIGLGWGYVSFQEKKLAEIPDTVVTIYIGLAATKTVQRFGEKGKPAEITTETEPKTS